MQAGLQGIGLQPPARACTEGASDVSRKYGDASESTTAAKTRTRAPVKLRKFKSADIDPVRWSASTDSHWSAAPTPAEVETADMIAQYVSGLSSPKATRHPFTTITRRPAAIDPLLYSEHGLQAGRSARQTAPGSDGRPGSARLPIKLRKFQSIDGSGSSAAAAPTWHASSPASPPVSPPASQRPASVGPSARRRVLVHAAQAADEPPPDRPRFAIVAAGTAAAANQCFQIASARRALVSARYGPCAAGDADPATTTRARLPTHLRMFRSQDVSGYLEPSPPSSPVFGGRCDSGLLPSNRQVGPSCRTATSTRPPVRLTELHRLRSRVSFSSDDAAHVAPRHELSGWSVTECYLSRSLSPPVEQVESQPSTFRTRPEHAARREMSRVEVWRSAAAAAPGPTVGGRRAAPRPAAPAAGVSNLQAANALRVRRQASGS
jgi:hypothetical protein